MIYRAWSFTLTSADDRLLGQAVLCAEARYASVAVPAVERIERRFATPHQWREIEHELAVGLPATPLPAAGPIATVLAGGAAARVRYSFAIELEVPSPEAAVGVLDAHLRSQLVKV